MKEVIEMDRPIITLFMLESLDGKINSGSNDSLDVDRDWKKIDGVKEGLYQYYEIEQTTDLCSFNTGRVMEKIGINERIDIPEKMDVTFVLLDRKGHLNENGLKYLSNWTKKTYVVTDNKEHPIYKMVDEYSNLEFIYYEEIDLKILMRDLKNKYGIERVTVQSGGTVNGLFLRNDLFDYVHVVIAPLLVGGKDTSTLIDGESIVSPNELNKLKALKLVECNKLSNSYLDLKYKVLR